MSITPRNIIVDLNKFLVYNAFIFFIMAVLVSVSILFISMKQGELYQLIDERQSLQKLNDLVFQTNEKILYALNKKSIEVKYVEISSLSEEFQAAFDAYYDSVKKRQSLGEVSLVKESGSNITQLRADMVKAITLIRSGRHQEALLFYQDKLSLRRHHVNWFTQEGIDLLDKIIWNKKEELYDLEDVVLIVSTFLPLRRLL